jgi:Fic family protein
VLSNERISDQVEVELKQRLGRYVVKTYEKETVRAFVPPPLPPDPPLRLDGLQQLLEQANQAVGRLDGLASILPDLSLFIYTYVRKEAVLSSQIEGTQSSLSDLLMFENDEVPGVPIQDVQEVSNYVAAMNHGLQRLRSGFPLSLRLIVKYTMYCSRRVAVAKSSRANLEGVRTGSAELGQGMLPSYHHRRS